MQGVVNSSGNGSISLHQNAVHVQLYGVVCTVLALLSVALISMATNGSLLACACAKKSVRTAYYTQFYHICILNILMCCVWLPLHVAQLARNYSGHGMHSTLCYVNAALLHTLATAMVIAVLFLTVQRLCHMRSMSAKGAGYVAVLGVVIAWALGAVAAVSVSMEFNETIAYAVCTFHPITHEHSHSTVSAVLATMYFIILVSILVLLLILLLVQRQSLSQQLKVKYADEEQEPSEAERLSLSAKRDSIVRLNGDQKLNDSSSNFIPISESVLHEEEEEEEEDDDTFEMKMRERQKSSGRRHTVANISLPDPNKQRRGSLGNISDRSPTSLACKYQYVRKWSVDIVALQDQLENPTRLSPTPFQGMQQRLLKIDQIHPQSDDAVDSLEGCTPQSSDSNLNKAAKKKKTVQLDHRIEEIDDLPDTPEASTPDEIPSIMVNNDFGKSEMKKSASIADSLQLSLMDREIAKTCKVIALLLLSIVCIVPFSLFHILSGVIGDQVKYNMCQLSPLALVLQGAFVPFLFVWMDRRLRQAIKRTRQEMKNWRCVCYCNIGKQKGQACFGMPPPSQQPAPQCDGTSNA